MSSPGMYLSINGVAAGGMMTYFVISDLFLGTRVKILPESKLRSFRCINSRMPTSSSRRTA